ncbi:MAG TPA: hypothetical protein VE078_00365 [Thermoanaerobaculia bacterium]|nr:hypothetical protein [Thermoanaerobaculia bacterium]
MHDMTCVALREWVQHSSSVAILMAAMVPITMGVAEAQVPEARDTWTFSRDATNNLIIQDLDTFVSSQGRGPSVCLQFRPVCPSSFDRRANDLRLAKPRYILRGIAGGSQTNWRIDPGQPVVRSTGTTLPFQVGGVEEGAVQVVSSPGPWAVDLQRIPAAELRVGDGKRWNVFLTLSDAPPEGSVGCWLEIDCPSG